MLTLEQFRAMDLRIARVVEAKVHPNADRLLVLTVEAGEDSKQIVAGIALHYKPEELVGKQVVLLNNLEPATIRGVTSAGMVLAAQGPEGLSLVMPDRAVPPGSTVR